MIAESQLQAATQLFFDAFASEAHPIGMLGYFSNTSPAIVQHTASTCRYPQASRLQGTNAIRSYFDLLATHWSRSEARIRSPLQINVEKRRVTLLADVMWTWKKSGRQWIEEFTWTLDYDEGFKIISFVIQTTSSPATCVMRAIDTEPSAHQKFLALTQGSVSSGALTELPSHIMLIPIASFFSVDLEVDIYDSSNTIYPSPSKSDDGFVLSLLFIGLVPFRYNETNLCIPPISCGAFIMGKTEVWVPHNSAVPYLAGRGNGVGAFRRF